MRIALVNSVILNGGDAGIVYGSRDAIKEILPSAQVTVFTHLTREAVSHFPDLDILPMLQDTWPSDRYLQYGMRKSFELRSTLKLLSGGEKGFYKQLKSMDAVVYCGGG